MKTLSKTNYDYILKMIANKDKINWIKSFCEGCGFDTNNYSSPVYIDDNKISIRYRRENKYFYL